MNTSLLNTSTKQKITKFYQLKQKQHELITLNKLPQCLFCKHKQWNRFIVNKQNYQIICNNPECTYDGEHNIINEIPEIISIDEWINIIHDEKNELQSNIIHLKNNYIFKLKTIHECQYEFKLLQQKLHQLMEKEHYIKTIMANYYSNWNQSYPPELINLFHQQKNILSNDISNNLSYNELWSLLNEINQNIRVYMYPNEYITKDNNIYEWKYNHISPITYLK